MGKEDGKYAVFYLDWGNCGLTEIASVDRPEDFWEIPALTVPCVLEGWQERLKKIFLLSFCF